ncbi:ImuA family protein [Mucilaginibacter sp. RCC_168]|uniref:ImuA family protein n=1 Tax=Mucilaginibacter sp. RCC_168 TaxID=3239221 RepID=UPI003525777B
MEAEKETIIARLRQDILAWEGFKPPQPGAAGSFGLGLLESAFPNGVFPTGAIHEFISECPEESSACSGVISGLLKNLLAQGGACLWVSYTRRIYPPALKLFGIDPDRIVFVDVPRQQDVLWVAEEALKCDGVAAVICETASLTFMESRRLQLAVEQSHVTGFILRKNAKKITATACIARWKVTPVLSRLRTGMPGVGYPRWQIELLKVRNGTPGSWTVEWRHHQFRPVTREKQPEKLRRYA